MHGQLTELDLGDVDVSIVAEAEGDVRRRLALERDPLLPAAVRPQDGDVALAEDRHPEATVRREGHPVGPAHGARSLPLGPEHAAEPLAPRDDAAVLAGVAVDLARVRLGGVEVAGAIERDAVRELEAAIDDRRLTRRRVEADHLSVGLDRGEARLWEVAIEELRDQSPRVGQVERAVGPDAEVVGPEQGHVADLGQLGVRASIERDREDRRGEGLGDPDASVGRDREAVRATRLDDLTARAVGEHLRHAPAAERELGDEPRAVGERERPFGHREVIAQDHVFSFESGSATAVPMMPVCAQFLYRLHGTNASVR